MWVGVSAVSWEMSEASGVLEKRNLFVNVDGVGGFLRDFLYNRHVFVFVKNDVASIFVRIGNRFFRQHAVLQIE